MSFLCELRVFYWVFLFNNGFIWTSLICFTYIWLGSSEFDSIRFNKGSEKYGINFTLFLLYIYHLLHINFSPILLFISSACLYETKKWSFIYQWRIQNPTKHLRWCDLRKLFTAFKRDSLIVWQGSE